MSRARPAATIVTGATGYLGSLLVAGLLAESSRHSAHHEQGRRLVLPVRARHMRDSVLVKIIRELEASGHAVSSELLDRVRVVPLPPTAEIPGLCEAFRDEGVDEIVHAAGCVDYFNTHNLKLGNVELTRALVELGQALNVRRFHFISTAFCSGYRDDMIPETLHAPSSNDPTEYTRSKRDTEALVAGSGLPYVIIRPSVVIGDSRDGRYGGKRYGIYQVWHAAERFLCAEYLERIYALAPFSPLHVLHQDAFVAGFLGAYRMLEPPAVLHLVSREEDLPTIRDLWDLWLETCARPQEIHYYERHADVHTEQLSRQQQMILEFSSVNVDIGMRKWHFETTHLDRMRAAGLQFADVSLDTFRVCQDRFIADSPRVQAFMDKYRTQRNVWPQVIEGGQVRTFAPRGGQ